MLIGLTSMFVMVSGAGAFALVRTPDQPLMVQPYGADAPFGVGYIDGFGEHSPRPTRQPPASRAKPRPSASPVITATAVPSQVAPPAAPSLGIGQQPDGARLSAVYWTTTWNSNYDTYVWVRNEGAEAADWEVRIQLPEGATVSTALAVRASYVDNTWVFTSTRGQLRPHHIYLFAFSGRATERFGLHLCSINGSSCARFR